MISIKVKKFVIVENEQQLIAISGGSAPASVASILSGMQSTVSSNKAAALAKIANIKTTVVSQAKAQYTSTSFVPTIPTWSIPTLPTLG